MLSKLEEDAEVAYNEYDKAVKAEDRAANQVRKVIDDIKNFLLKKVLRLYFSVKRCKLEQLRKMQQRGN